MLATVFSESDYDEASVLILSEAVLQRPIERVPGLPPLRRRSGGWDNVRLTLPAVIKHVYYQSAAEGIIVVADSNGTTPHGSELHSPSLPPQSACRLCALSDVSQGTLAQLRSVHGRPMLKVAVGLAVPAIEAWYLCGKEPRVSEAAWIQGMQSGRLPYDKNELKRLVYGTDRPSSSAKLECATREARRLSQDLPSLRRLFPHGFGALADALASW